MKASKAAARDERRVARNIRQKLIDSGELDPTLETEVPTASEDDAERTESAPSPEVE